VQGRIRIRKNPNRDKVPRPHDSRVKKQQQWKKCAASSI
jgi:hypothetical protein